tara:strand:- start:588 stop:839 length:252 start_codon:yes stop_codon:yes gene_type:complete
MVNRVLSVNKFWPPRGEAEGFSIEKLAKRSRQKLMKADSSLFKAEDSIKTNDNVIENTRLTLLRNQVSSHWANRYFEEYRDSA